MKLVAHGHTNAEIGALLYLSPKTVDTYRRRVMQTRARHAPIWSTMR
ncbi:LuxR C-terminal-related transcriptional regulator [Candidatus Flexifilum breve]